MTRPRSYTLIDLSRRIPSVMRTEFGRVLENLMDVPGSMGAVLVDDNGYAVDYVFDPKVLEDLEIQLVGAQMGQSVMRTSRSAAKLDLGTPAVLLEGNTGNLMSAPVGDLYVLAFVMHRKANVAVAFARFEAVRSTIEHLLS